jgi:tRNA nucleotidyltransferase (CCA-adding enzyme)
MVGFDQKNYHHCYDVWEHTLHALEKTPRDAVLRCAVLLHDVGKPMCFTVDAAGVGHFYGHGTVSLDFADNMLRRLKCSNEFRETVVRLVEWHDRMIPVNEKGVRKALRRLGETDLRRLIAVKRADNFGQAPEFRGRQQELDEGEAIMEQLLKDDACFSLKQMVVNGHDIIQLGITGPLIGQTLNELLDEIVNGTLPNEREPLLEAARKRRKV